MLTNCKMNLCLVKLIVFFSLYLKSCMSSYDKQSPTTEFDVMNYGAKRDGKTDDSKAMLVAWKQACNLSRPSKMVIPLGSYMLGPVEFEGPCKAPVTLRVEGTLRAPISLEAFKSLQNNWVVFRNIDGLTILGGGTFDGQGKVAWSQNNCGKSGDCIMPTNLQFTGITNGIVQDITSLDSKMFHMNILISKYVTFKNITVQAPASSLNTDGIHIGRSSYINITGANISTGDDCVSLGDGSQHIHVEKVNCGPGHGISVGSLGKYRAEQPVVDFSVKNCTLTNTMNGVRIKTWPDSFNGIASDLHFEDIIMNNVGNPILIDQDYCPSGGCKISVPSRIKISDVLFRNIKGTSATQLAMRLICSQYTPCQNVTLSEIDLAYMGEKGTAFSQCSNVSPTIMGNLSPHACSRS